MDGFMNPFADDGGMNPTKIFPNKKNSKKDEESTPQFGATGNKAPKGNKLTKYEDLYWKSLPSKAKSAAETLGFNQKAWDEDGWPECEETWWEDLTAAEQSAATTLGWDINSWDNQYEELNWSDLPKEVQKAASKLGFTQEMWDYDEWPERLNVWWEDLSDADQRNLMVLGYTQHTWE